MPSNGNWGTRPGEVQPNVQGGPSGVANQGGGMLGPPQPAGPGGYPIGGRPYGPPQGSPGGGPQGPGGRPGPAGVGYIGPPVPAGRNGGYRPMPQPGSGWPGQQRPPQTVQPGGPMRFNPQGGKASPMTGPNGQQVWVWNGKVYPYDPTAGGMGNPGIEDGNPFAPPWDPGQAY